MEERVKDDGVAELEALESQAATMETPKQRGRPQTKGQVAVKKGKRGGAGAVAGGRARGGTRRRRRP